MTTAKDKAKSVVDQIIADLSDRQGLGDVWDDIDEDVQAEIREKWMSIVHGDTGV